MPENGEKDPVVSQSLAAYLLIASVLLIASLGWALYDESYGLRPWKTYQRRFARQYRTFLRTQIPKQEVAEKQVRASAEFQALEQAYQNLEAEMMPRSAQLDAQIRVLDQRLSVVTQQYTDARAWIASRIYQIEHSPTLSGRKSLERDIEEFQREVRELELVSLDGSGQREEKKFTYPELEAEFNALQAEKARRLAEKAELVRPLSEARRQRDAYLQNHLNGLPADMLRGLLTKAQEAPTEIRQINNPDAGIVDRCESCHLGIREPVVLTKADLGGEGAFTSHPELELLRIHNPEKFGCAPCHNGNGMQVQSVKAGHGLYKHWLWPLHARENFESGCQQCHARDMLLDYAPVLSQGKNLFYYRGCMGCHRYAGYDPEPEELISVQQSIQQLEAERGATQRGIERAIQGGDEAPDNETARRMYARADALRVAISNLDARLEQLDQRSGNLLREIKKIGPDLKEARVKLRPEWLPVWIQNPHDFRPTTRMPRFRLTAEEVKTVSAFIWKSAIDAQLPAQPPGDPARGKENFETRGCLGCHSVGEGEARVGGTFAANLTRVGEKVNYDYLVRWIHDPRERTRPYCPYEKRDLTEQDYRKRGLPFVFDFEHSTCPNDGHELLVEQMTVMPSLRLSWQEARDIASYLITLRKQDPKTYAPAPFLNDPNLAEQGKRVAQRYGCAGCHEIAGLETEGRIGTELTEWGSKPIDQIDFGLFKTPAKHEGWRSHKGFVERKLAKPEMYDEGLVRKPEERLRMPNLDLKPREITALATFLLGSVNSELPERYFYLPEDPRRDIQEGWWVARKYNCMGCHQFRMDMPSDLMQLARYQTPEGKDQLPPRLLSEGARVAPEWLARFLANPAMSEADADRNGVRPYLKVRMPTFYFSPGEVRKLVRFFQALNSQPMPYIAPKPEPLTPQELTLARALFTSRAAPCLKCHATGEPAHDRFATAPNFLLGRERLKPGWTRRWLLDPSMIDPGTAMPTGLFRRDGERWVFAGPTPPLFGGYAKDHAELLVRYMMQITPEEQRRLVGMGGAEASTASAARGARTQAALQGRSMQVH